MNYSPNNHWCTPLVRLGRTLSLLIILTHTLTMAAAAETRLVPASTIVSGNIATNTTWTKTGSPYIVTADVTVDAGVTLTIEPGVEVQFNNNTRLTALGEMIALGTVTDAITFTGSTQTAGAWRGLTIQGTPATPNRSKLSYVTVEYGGLSFQNEANLTLSYTEVTITHSTFRDGLRHGIYGQTKGLAHISDSSFSNNPGYAILFTDTTIDPILTGLTAGGNGVNGVGLGLNGYVEADHTWEATGIPYIIEGNHTVKPDATLTIEPGVEVQFLNAAGLDVQGVLTAVGLPDQPIIFTGTSPAAGWWDGISVSGSAQAPGTALFDYVTIEYGGRSTANLTIDDGQVAVHHAIIRFSDRDGIIANGNTRITVEASQIVSNANFGIRNNSNKATDLVFAANNWWGAATGPTAQYNPAGTGDEISGNVAFSPFLTAPDQEPDPFAPNEAKLIRLTPQRWFVPADGQSRLWVTITLTDGSGLPVPNRTVQLSSSLGTVQQGGITDVKGQVLAYITATNPGEAELVASLASFPGEFVGSASATVTFTPVSAEDDLLPDSAAPYLTNGIEISPKPIVRGVPTTLRATLVNPNSFPIIVDASLGFAQSGIGLAFGPLGEVTDRVIAAKGQTVIEVPWTPIVSGHYCFELQYTTRTVTGTSLAQTQLRSFQENAQISPGPMEPPNGKDTLNKAEEALGRLDKGFTALDAVTSPENLPTGFIQGAMTGYIVDNAFEKARISTQSLGFDPPRQDYYLIATLEHYAFTPLQPGPDLSQSRADATNAMIEAILDLTAKLRAASLSLDRASGAAEAADLYWSSRQNGALLFYKQEAGQTMMQVADRIEALLAVMEAEGIQDMTVTAQTYAAYQQRLSTQGFSAEELQAGQIMGLTAEEMEAMRQERLALNPEEVAGSIFSRMRDLIKVYRKLGDLFVNPPNFPGTVNLNEQGELTISATDPDNNLVRIFNNVSTIQIGNPFNQTTTIDLRVRPIDLPPDWLVAVSPRTVTLEPGQQISATITTAPGLAATQGTIPRVAIEGYANNELISGVVIDVVVPQFIAFDGRQSVYLPLIQR